MGLYTNVHFIITFIRCYSRVTGSLNAYVEPHLQSRCGGSFFRHRFVLQLESVSVVEIFLIILV